MNIIPTLDRVLVEDAQKERTTASGIIIPGESKDSNRIGVVVSVGPGKENDGGTIIKPPVEIGQKILFSWGEKVESDGKEYYIVDSSNVLAVIN